MRFYALVGGMICFLGLVTVAQAEVLVVVPGETTIDTSSPYVVSVDASGHQNLYWSFDYNAQELDGNGSPLDRFEYGWSSGGTGEHILGVFEGMTGDAGEEIGSVGEFLPGDATSADLELFVRVIATPGGASDQVTVSDIELSGEPVVTTGEVEVSFEVLGDDAPEGEFGFMHTTGPSPDEVLVFDGGSVVRVVDMGTHTFVGSPVSGYALDSSDCLDLVVEPEAFVTCTIVYTHIEPDIAIISPVANDTVTAGSVTIAAEYREGTEVIKDIDWTVFRGACDALGLPVAGNTAGFTDEGTLLGPSFFANVSITEAGPYCVQIDPRDEAGTVFAEQNFSVVTEPVFAQDGYVRRDSEGDGIYSTVEAGLRNWTVYARQLDGARSFVARTNASGYFKFLLPADRFVIAYEVPSNWTQTAVYSGSEKQESNTCTHFVGESATSSECSAFFFSVPQPSVGGGTKVTLKAPVGRVLGAATATSSVQTAAPQAHRCESGLYLSSYMGFSGITAPATEVLKLQVFLNAVGLPVPMTMVYDGATRAAVRDFQNRYTAEILAPWGLTQGTGVVYTLTRWKINTMICAHAEPKPLVP